MIGGDESPYWRCSGCGCTPEFRCLPGGCEYREESGICSACEDESRPFHAHAFAEVVA